MALPTAQYPASFWNGNEQSTANDGAADPTLAQGNDYNLAAAEVLALENELGTMTAGTLKGTLTSLAERLAISLNNNGTIKDSSVGSSQLAAGAVSSAKLVDALADKFATATWGSAGSEVGDAIEIDLQLSDIQGNALSEEVVPAIRVSNSPSGPGSSTATISARATPLGTILEGSGTNTVRVRTNASGQVGIKVSESGASDRYLNISPTYGSKILEATAEAILTFV